ERLRLIQRLTTEIGLNLAGVERVLHLEDELQQMKRRFARMEAEMRVALQEVHRQYRRDLVLYRPAQPPVRRSNNRRFQTCLRTVPRTVATTDTQTTSTEGHPESATVG